MTVNYYFDIKRFGNLLRRESYNNLKLFLIALGAVSGLIFIIFLITILDVEGNGNRNSIPWSGHNIFFMVSFVVIGIFFTSVAYKELLGVNRRYAYLTLPVSNLERFLSMLLMTTVVYTVFYIAYFYLFSSFLNLLGMMFTPREFEFFNVRQKEVVTVIKIYGVVQSIFLLGAASFKRYPFLFTMLTIFLASMALTGITALGGRIIFADFFGNGPNLNMDHQLSPEFKDFVEHDMKNMLENIFWYGLAPFCWILTYLKLKEREV